MSETPLLSQYRTLKEKNSDTLLAFRIGDFYEFLYEDAEIASKVLGITLTSKPLYKGHRAPLAGIPAKAAWQYFEKLVKSGFKVAICEQTGEGKKLMEREIIEVLTPGTFFHPDYTDETSNIYIAALTRDGAKSTLVVADISTGEIIVEKGKFQMILERVDLYKIKELLVEEEIYFDLANSISTQLTKVSSPLLTVESLKEKLLQFFKAPSLKIINIEEDPLEIKALYILINFLEDKKPGMLGHLKSIKRVNSEKVLLIDPRTAKHLELVEKPYEGEGGTLFSHLKETLTPQGTRFLRENILSPLRDIEKINKRLARVQYFVENREVLKNIREELKKVSDIERLISRFSTQKYHIRDFLRLSETINALVRISTILNKTEIFEPMDIQESVLLLADQIESIVPSEPPAEPPGWVKEGVNKELDELKYLMTHAREKLLELERKERERTGIPNLRVGYNQVFGFYYEVTKSHLDKVPPYFIRKQTLQNAERFFTEELKELEEKIVTAEERTVEIEKKIIEDLRLKIINQIESLSQLANYSKELDLIQAFAKVSLDHKYSKPEIHNSIELIIKDGRHPVVERFSKEKFVPNDTYLNEENIMYIITGPNMSGKSTYLRQVALIVLLAHMGCFVPATHAEIPLTDRIFSRIGASDDVTRGVSTFMAEMMETAEILRNATNHSLLILDEIGRGTSTTDGIAIAWACAEYIATRIKAKTLFATHYHELSELAKFIKNVRNYHMMVSEWNNTVIFMRKLKEGALNKSYGIHVASLSGIPDEVIKRATEIAADLEKKENDILTHSEQKGQLSLFDRGTKLKPCKVCEILKSIDIDGISPREALNLLYKLKEESDKCLNS
ncbi:MAG: DNA mismatch repair protein MutS [Candidatus Hydrothermia bacterium]